MPSDECNCTGPYTQTCHASNPEGHQVGCPQWGARPTLPGTPGPGLQGVWSRLSPGEKEAFRDHLLGSTSAEWLSQTMCRYGYGLSATTIRTYRRALKNEGGVQV